MLTDLPTPVSASDLAVLETPLLRVSRPVAACQRCRAAKIKCDGKLPACTACEKSNRASECSSTNDQFARGKERSYVATLEGKIERLDKKIAEAKARRQSSVQMLDVDAPPRRSSVETVKGVKSVSKRAERRKEASDIDELVSDFGLLAVNATARDFYGFTTEMSYARLILSASTKEPMPAGLTKTLPPRYAAIPLIKHYVNNIYSLLPIFEEANLYACVDSVYHLNGIGKPFDFWVVRMVLAIASLSQSEQRGDTLYSDAVGHVNAALEHAEKVLHPGFITSIQALVLLVIYATMDPHHFDSWTLIGAASRAMVDLGIHQDPSRSTPMSKQKLEIRRRVYWCVYSLDRSTSLVQTRAFSFSDDSAHVHLPFHSSSTSTRQSSPQSQVFLQSFDSALDLFRIRQLQSEWYMDLFQSGRDPWADPYPYIWKMYHRMSEWFNKMSQSTLPALKSFFELELLYSYVYILSPSSRVPCINENAQRLIFEHCIAYATNLLASISMPSNTTKPPVTFYDAMRAYMTGRQFVDVVSRNMDVLLDPRQPSPPAASNLAMTNNEDQDPLSAPPPIAAPPFPIPLPPDSQALPQDPTVRAINAINDFTCILSRFGLRFGFTHWRDRFQRESGPLLSQLYNRASISPHGSSPSQLPVQSPYQQQPQQQWLSFSSTPAPSSMAMSMSMPIPPASSPLYPSSSPQFPHSHNPINLAPTTPPTTTYAPHSSPFSHSTSPYNNTAAALQYSQQSQQQQLQQQQQDWHSSSPQHHQKWNSSPPPTLLSQQQSQGQGLPDMPQPAGGRVRQALVFGPGITSPEGLQSQGQKQGQGQSWGGRGEDEY